MNRNLSLYGFNRSNDLTNSNAYIPIYAKKVFNMPPDYDPSEYEEFEKVEIIREEADENGGITETYDLSEDDIYLDETDLKDNY